MGNAGDVCWDTVGMFQVGIKGGISPFWELRNLAVLAQELALKNGRDGLSGRAWGGGLWVVMGGVRPLSSRLSPQHCLSEIEVLAIIFAAAIHDYEHTGTTNSFHIQTK